MQFQYEAMTQSGAITISLVEAASLAEATEALRRRGVMVLKLDAAPESAAAPAPMRLFSRVSTRDLVLFCRQMKMLLESGSPLVPALEAIEKQTTKPTLVQILRQMRERVEGGGTLNDAMNDHPEVFRPVFRSMIAAGEATATLPRSFDQLSDLTQRQMEIRRAVTSAALYPSLLAVLCLGVIIVLLTFVVPRFRLLFTNLKSKLPATTEIMFAVSDLVLHYWPFIIAAFVALIVGAVMALRSRTLRAQADPLLLRLPILGRLIARLQMARVLRVWAAMLGSHVPLLETIEQSKAAVSNSVFAELLERLQDSVAQGGKIGQVLRESGRVEPIIASAISTGEDNSRLAEATEFVSTWMDDDNTRMIANVTRIAEPALLVIMGAVVGVVAMSLFMPLFDIATAA